MLGGVLNLGAPEQTTTGPIGKTGNIVFNGGILQYSATNQNDYSGRFSTAANQQYNVDTNGQTVTWATALTSSGGNLIKSGSGTLILSAANTFSGTTAITSGTLLLSNSLALQNSMLTTGGFGLAFSASVTSHAFTLGGLSGSANILLTDNGGNAVMLTVTNNDSFTGTLSGAGGLTKSGTGTVTLSSSSSFTGATIVNNGILAVTANGALGGAAASGVTVGSGATLHIHNVNYAQSEALMLNGTGYNGAGALTVTGSSAFAGAITAQTNATINVSGSSNLTLTGGVTKNGTVLTFSGGGTVNINGQGISGSAANSDLVVDASTVVLNVVNSYNGPTTVQNGGTLQLGASNVLPTAPATAMTLQSGGTLDLQNYRDTVASLTMNTGNVIATSGTITSAGAVTVNGTNNVIGTGATVALSGTAAVNGSLIVHGSIAGAVKVNSGGTLAGEGSVGALTVNTGAVLAAGNPATGTGTLTTGNLTVQNNATLALEVKRDVSGAAGTTYAKLSTGALDLTAITSVSLGGGIKISLQNVIGDVTTFDTTSNHLWQNVIVSTSLTGLSSFTPSAANNFDQKLGQFAINSDSLLGALGLGNHFFLMQDQTNVNALDLQYLASVPEPQTWALLAGGVGLIGLAQRLRRRVQS